MAETTINQKIINVAGRYINEFENVDNLSWVSQKMCSFMGTDKVGTSSSKNRWGKTQPWCMAFSKTVFIDAYTECGDTEKANFIKKLSNHVRTAWGQVNGELKAEALNLGFTTSKKPAPGCLFFLGHNGEKTGHAGLIVSTKSSGMCDTVEGNTGSTKDPGGVQRNGVQTKKQSKNFKGPGMGKSYTILGFLIPASCKNLKKMEESEYSSAEVPAGGPGSGPDTSSLNSGNNGTYQQEQPKTNYSELMISFDSMPVANTTPEKPVSETKEVEKSTSTIKIDTITIKTANIKNEETPRTKQRE